MHRHTREDEAYYILEGEYAIYYPDAGPVYLYPGEFIHVPQGTVHTYKSVGPGRGHMLVMTAPGGLEHFFEELGVPALDRTHPSELTGPPDFARMAAIAAKYGIEIVGPPA